MEPPLPPKPPKPSNQYETKYNEMKNHAEDEGLLSKSDGHIFLAFAMERDREAQAVNGFDQKFQPRWDTDKATWDHFVGGPFPYGDRPRALTPFQIQALKNESTPATGQQTRCLPNTQQSMQTAGVSKAQQRIQTRGLPITQQSIQTGDEKARTDDTKKVNRPKLLPGEKGLSESRFADSNEKKSPSQSQSQSQRQARSQPTPKLKGAQPAPKNDGPRWSSIVKQPAPPPASFRRDIGLPTANDFKYHGLERLQKDEAKTAIVVPTAEKVMAQSSNPSGVLDRPVANMDERSNAIDRGDRREGDGEEDQKSQQLWKTTLDERKAAELPEPGARNDTQSGELRVAGTCQAPRGKKRKR